jgi:complex iron-sulfur molybdoenzyme family reductase subunit gamma
MMKWSRKGLALAGALALIGVLAGVFGAPTATSQVTALDSVRAPESPNLDPDWRLWAKLPGIDVPLTMQNLAYPMGGGARSVNLRSAWFGDTLYIRAAWTDPTRDDMAVGVDQFTDAAAVEFPAKSAVMVPSFCMGQANASVNIWQWRAAAQTGDPVDAITALYPNGYSDSYPDELTKNPIYQPARSLGNPAAAVSDTPVQNLVAQAFGTLSPAADQVVTGQGVWRDGQWSVVFARRFAGSDVSQAEFAPGVSTNMAVAVWNGSQGERSGQKSVSQFVTLSISPSALVEGAAHDWGAIWLALLLGGAAAVTGLVVLTIAGMWSAGPRRS